MSARFEMASRELSLSRNTDPSFHQTMPSIARLVRTCLTPQALKTFGFLIPIHIWLKSHQTALTMILRSATLNLFLRARPRKTSEMTF